MTRDLEPGVIVAVRRRFDRTSHLVVRIVTEDWIVGHHPATGLCHRAWRDDIISIVAW